MIGISDSGIHKMPVNKSKENNENSGNSLFINTEFSKTVN